VAVLAINGTIFIPLIRSFLHPHLSFVGGIASFSSTVLALNGYLENTLLDSWAVSPSFCCLIDCRRGSAGTPIQRHDNGFLSCQAPPWIVYDLRLRRELLSNCTTSVPNTPFWWGGLIFAASIFCCAPSKVSSCYYKLMCTVLFLIVRVTAPWCHIEILRFLFTQHWVNVYSTR